MTKTTLKKRPVRSNTNNYIETGQNPVKAVAKSVVNDVLKGGMNDFWKQVLTAGNSTNSENNVHQETKGGDLQEGQELVLKNLQKKEEKQPEAEAGEIATEYRRQILHAESISARKNTQEIDQKVSQILMELRRLIQTTKELQVEFKEVATAQRVVNPGKYHASFFEWMLSVVKQARMKVEDSGAWLAAMQSKKKQRQYGAMAKKHGTTFSLSNERVVATQVG